MAFQIGRSADDEPADVAGEALGHHVLGDGSAVADARVVAAVDDVDHAVAYRQFDLDVGVALEECRHHRAHKVVGGFGGHAQANAAHRCVAEQVHDIQRLADLLEGPGDRSLQRLACRGQGDAAAGPVQQAHAQTLLEPAQRVAQRRGAYAQIEPRPPKVAMLGDLQEVGEVCIVRSSELHRQPLVPPPLRQLE